MCIAPEASTALADSKVQQEGITQGALLIKALATSRGIDEFIRVAQLAVDAFDHNITPVHDKLVEAGALTVLVKCLARSVSVESRWDEIDPTCKLLCMALRCSDRIATNELGAVTGDLCPTLLGLTLQSNKERRAPDSVYQLLQRINGLQLNLCAMQQSIEILRFIQDVIRSCELSGRFERSFHALRFLASAAANVQNKRYILDFPGIFDSIVDCFTKRFRPNIKVNKQVGRLLRSLAWDPANKFDMVRRRDFPRLLMLLFGEESVETRAEAIMAFNSIAVETFGRTKLFECLGPDLVDALYRMTLNDELAVLSLEALLHLVSRDTAETMCKHSLLIKHLLCLASTEAPTTTASDTTAADLKPASVAAQVMKRLCTYLPLHGLSKGRLLESMAKIAFSSNHRIRYWMTCALVEQSHFSGCNYFIARTKAIVDVVSDLSKDERFPVKSSAIDLVLSLASNALNCSVLAKANGLLETLADTATTAGADTATQRKAVLAILFLTQRKRSMKIVAKHHSIVSSLSSYAVSHDDDAELRMAALHGVICLASYM